MKIVLQLSWSCHFSVCCIGVNWTRQCEKINEMLVLGYLYSLFILYHFSNLCSRRCKIQQLARSLLMLPAWATEKHLMQ
jgi:hypothetical protein